MVLPEPLFVEKSIKMSESLIRDFLTIINTLAFLIRDF